VSLRRFNTVRLIPAVRTPPTSNRSEPILTVTVSMRPNEALSPRQEAAESMRRVTASVGKNYIAPNIQIASADPLYEVQLTVRSSVRVSKITSDLLQ
jgi:hypothetical protein